MSQNYFVSRNIHGGKRKVNVFSLSSVLQHTLAKFSTLCCVFQLHVSAVALDINLSGEKSDQLGRYL